MPRKAKAILSLPVQTLNLLVQVGKQIQIARKRRKYSEEKLAKLASVSRMTLRKLEKGDPGVSLGVLLSVLWALQLEKDVLNVASPDTDTQGVSLESYLPCRIREKKRDTEQDDYDF